MKTTELELRKEFGVYLRNLRHRAGMTQTSVASLCGHDNAQFISNIERGRCAIPVDVLIVMSEQYKVSKKSLAKKYNRISLLVLEQEMGIKKSS